MRILPAVVAFSFAMLVAVSVTAAQNYRAGDLTIVHPWARETLTPVQASAVYFTIVNDGTKADRLLGVSTPAAERAMLHRTVMDRDIARMVAVEEIEIAAASLVMLEPGGLHVMLTGLATPLVENKTFILTLIFVRAGKVEVEVLVEGLTPDPGHNHIPRP